MIDQELLLTEEYLALNQSYQSLMTMGWSASGEMLRMMQQEEMTKQTRV